MVERIINEVCRAMSAELTTDQLRKLEAVLCIQMKDVDIRKQTYEIEPAEAYSDAKAVKEFLASKRIGGRAALKKIGIAADVSKVHPHRFRRTFASEASHRQIPLEDLKELMGHEKLDTTLLYIDNERDIEAAYRKYVA